MQSKIQRKRNHQFKSHDDLTLSPIMMRSPEISRKTSKPRSNSIIKLRNQEILSFPLFYSRFKKIFTRTKSNLMLVQERIESLLDKLPFEDKTLLIDLSTNIGKFLTTPTMKVLKEECRAFVEKIKELEAKLNIGETYEVFKISLKTNTSPRLPSPAIKHQSPFRNEKNGGGSRVKAQETAIIRTFTWLRYSLAELLNFSLIFSIFYQNVEPNFSKEEISLKRTLRIFNKEEFFLEIMEACFSSEQQEKIAYRNMEDLKAFLGLKIRKWLSVNRETLQKTIAETHDKSNKLVCRLCESYIKAEFMKIHSDICHQLIEQKKNIIQIEQSLAALCNTGSRIQQKLFLEMEAFKKKPAKKSLRSQNSFQLSSAQTLPRRLKRNSKSIDFKWNKSPEVLQTQISFSAQHQHRIALKHVKSFDQRLPANSPSLSSSPGFQSQSPTRNHIKPSIFKGSPRCMNPGLNLIIPSVKTRPKALAPGVSGTSVINNSQQPPKRRPDSIILRVEEDGHETFSFEIRTFQIPTVSNALNSVIKYRTSLSKGMKIGDLTNELMLKKELEISLKELREKNLEAFLKKILEKIEEKLQIQWKIDSLELNERKQIRAFANNQGLKSQSSPSFKKAKTNRRFSNAEGRPTSKSLAGLAKKPAEMGLETVEEVGSSLIANAHKISDQNQSSSSSQSFESESDSESDGSGSGSIKKNDSANGHPSLFRKQSNPFAFKKLRKFQSETNIFVVKNQEYNIGVKDFTFLKFLGKGAYGGVYLVRKKGTGDLYAMKVVNIETLDQHKMENFKAERNAIELVEGDFIVKAYYFFKHKHYICFVLEYMPGGDMSSILKTYARLENETAKFYAAELVLAIESLHRKGIIHRDLKPENILLDSSGHIKLADFGLSEVGVSRKIKGQATPFLKNFKKISDFEEHNVDEIKLFQSKRTESMNSDRSLTDNLRLSASIGSKGNSLLRTSKPLLKSKKGNRIVGTPDYIPPEVLKGDSISNASIDWWSLGVILYELIVGIPPFNDETVPLIFENILERRFQWPEIGDGEDCMTESAMDLIDRLLEVDYGKRLGAHGADEIKRHEYFDGIYWKEIRNLNPPINKGGHSPHFHIGNEKADGLGELFMENSKVTKDVILGINKELEDLTRFDLLSKLNEEDAEKMM